MGKVAIVVGGILIALGIIAAVSLIVSRRTTRFKALQQGLPVKGDLSTRQERKILAANRLAADLMHRMLTQPIDLGKESTLLSPSHRLEMEQWIKHHSVNAPTAYTPIHTDKDIKA